MKKSNIVAIVLSLVIVLCVSFGATYLLQLLNRRTYTPSKSLTAGLTEGMKMNEIAEVYVDSCVTVNVKSTSPNGKAYGSMGSAVCIAGNSYITNSGYKATKGSYFATNYHVISRAVDTNYKDFKTEISITINDGDESHNAELLWESKDMDVAVLYCDGVNLDWIEMKDRSVYPTKEDKFSFSSIFTIGTPIDPSYQNTYSEGYVKNLNFEMKEATATTVYTYKRLNGNYEYCTNEDYVSSLKLLSDLNEKTLFDNIYEDVVMMSCDITNGNSGGGVFDSNGYLVGLSTLGMSVENSGSAAMNFFVPIYPVMQVLDRLIENKENGLNATIYSPETLGLKVIDSVEVGAFTQYDDKQTPTEQNLMYFNGRQSYYFDEEFYDAIEYSKAFSFRDEGVYVMRNTGSYSLTKGLVITSVSKGKDKINITDRNDLLYFLLGCNKGDIVSFDGYGASGATFTL